jgi:nucleotide-binding universal stress UspA family protein
LHHSSIEAAVKASKRSERRRPAMKLDRILAPLDGSPLAESALGKAAELAGGDSTTLMLLRAAEAPTLPGVETCLWYGSAAAAIVAAASLRKADLIVMSSHGRSGLGWFILGSSWQCRRSGASRALRAVKGESLL